MVNWGKSCTLITELQRNKTISQWIKEQTFEQIVLRYNVIYIELGKC